MTNDRSPPRLIFYLITPLHCLKAYFTMDQTPVQSKFKRNSSPFFTNAHHPCETKLVWPNIVKKLQFEEL
jgi:hypothetical protein